MIQEPSSPNFMSLTGPHDIEEVLVVHQHGHGGHGELWQYHHSIFHRPIPLNTKFQVSIWIPCLKRGTCYSLTWSWFWSTRVDIWEDLYLGYLMPLMRALNGMRKNIYKVNTDEKNEPYFTVLHRKGMFVFIPSVAGARFCSALHLDRFTWVRTQRPIY